MTAFAEDSHKESVGANTTPARPVNAEETARAVKLLALMGRRDYMDGRLPDSRELAVCTSMLSNSPNRNEERAFT